jgi:hypothetical protein
MGANSRANGFRPSKRSKNGPNTNPFFRLVPTGPNPGFSERVKVQGDVNCWVLRARRRVWWGRGWRLASGFGSGRAARRARTAGRQNVDNSPAHLTSPFSPQSARGKPRHVGCSASSTTSARSHALFRGFSYKNFDWADRAAEGSMASKPMRGDKTRVFWGMCARFPGWFPRRF